MTKSPGYKKESPQRYSVPARIIGRDRSCGSTGSLESGKKPLSGRRGSGSGDRGMNTESTLYGNKA